MPDTEETKIDVGDSEESPVEVDLSEEKSEAPSQEEQKVEVETPSDGKDGELEDYSRNAKSRINDLTAKYREEERQKQTAIQFAEMFVKRTKLLNIVWTILTKDIKKNLVTGLHPRSIRPNES